MSSVVTAYHNIQILPFELISIQELTIVKKNE